MFSATKMNSTYSCDMYDSSYQSRVIDEQRELIKTKTELLEKMTHKLQENEEEIVRIKGCLYNLIEGLLFQQKQENIISNYIDLVHRAILNQHYSPTSHQKDTFKCDPLESRLNNYKYVLDELLTNMQNKEILTKFQRKFYTTILESNEDYSKKKSEYDGYDDDAESVITFPDIDQEDDGEDDSYCNEVSEITNSMTQNNMINSCSRFKSKIDFNENFYGSY